MGGRSAIAFLNILPKAVITCIDTFEGSPNHWTDPTMQGQLSQLESRFDRNIDHGAKPSPPSQE